MNFCLSFVSLRLLSLKQSLCHRMHHGPRPGTHDQLENEDSATDLLHHNSEYTHCKWSKTHMNFGILSPYRHSSDPHLQFLIRGTLLAISRCLFCLKRKTNHIQNICNTCNTCNMLRTTWLYARSAPLWIKSTQVSSDSRTINNQNSKQSTLWFAQKPKASFWIFSQQNKDETKSNLKNRARIVSRQRSVGVNQRLKTPFTNTLPCRQSFYQPPPPQAQMGAYMLKARLMFPCSSSKSGAVLAGGIVSCPPFFDWIDLCTRHIQETHVCPPPQKLLTIGRLLPYFSRLSMLYICFCP